MIVSALVLFVTANEQSLWTHEIVTVGDSDVRMGFGYRDAQMPLLYIFIFISRVIFGSYDIVYRLPILLMAFGLIQFIPWILKREGLDPITSWIAPYLLLFLPRFIYYAQEVRAWMPMAVCVIAWGAFRHIRGWKGWLLCTVALQSNTVSIFYVAAVAAVDWANYRIRKTDKPSLAPVIAMITHIPSILIMFMAVGSSPYTPLDPVETGFKLNEIFKNIINFEGTLGYIVKSFHFFFQGSTFFWIAIILFSLFTLFWKQTPFKRFWIGILVGLIVNAHFFISIRLILLNPKFLILMLPMFCIVPFLFHWKRQAVSASCAIIIIVFAHFTPSLNIRETMAKMDRGYKSKPWQGVVPQLFSRTSNALIYPQRSDWKQLTLLLNALAKPGDTVLLKDCFSCYVYDFQFYDRNFSEKIKVRNTNRPGDCSNWIVSTAPLGQSKACGLPLLIRLDRLYVYGKSDVSIREPIRSSRRL